MVMLWMLGWLAFADIVPQADPQLGEPVTLQVVDLVSQPVIGTTVRVTYREGLAGSREQTLGTTDSRGTISWIPNQVGRVRVRVGSESLVVRVGGPLQPGSVGWAIALWFAGFATLVAATGYARRP